MKTFRINAVMAGVLYTLGTVFGMASTIIGGEVISSVVKTKSLPDINLMEIGSIP
jgi:hypothetical protein